jgi:prepilin-type N-terminal cleavage/methylation domain-containing protein
MNARDRRGFTLVELAIALTLLVVVGGAVATAVTSAWRTHDDLEMARRARQATGDAADLLRAELRAASPAAGDLVAVWDSAIVLRATTGASVVCSVTLARDRFTIPALRPAVGAPLTWWRDMPMAGDSIDLFDGRGALPDTISRHGLVRLAGGVCPQGSGFSRSPADAAAALELEVSPPLPPSIGPGAPVRFLRDTRYSVYRSATDSRWYLGIRERVGGAWTVIQPVAGPFSPPAVASGGMSLRLIDTAGALVPAPPYNAVRALEISLRSAVGGTPRAAGRSRPVAESLHVVLAPRNE